MRRNGSRRSVGGVTVWIAPGISGRRPRVAIVAGRSVGNAVTRNRAKRRLREAVALAPVRPGSDYVVVGGAEVVSAPFRDVVDWVSAAVS